MFDFTTNYEKVHIASEYLVLHSKKSIPQIYKKKLQLQIVIA
jgi:hypothetical protein